MFLNFQIIHSIYFCLSSAQRVCTSIEGMRGVGGRFFTKIEPTVTDPCRTVYALVQCREPKTGQNKGQFYCKDDWL